MEVHPLIERLVRLGITVSVTWEPFYERYLFDLNTGAKESMVAWMENPGSGTGLTLETRYDRRVVVRTFVDLCNEFETCLIPGGNCSPEWASMLKAIGHWGADHVV